MVNELFLEKHLESSSYYINNCEIGLKRQHLYCKTLDNNDNFSCLIKRQTDYHKDSSCENSQAKHITNILSYMSIEFSKFIDNTDIQKSGRGLPDNSSPITHLKLYVKLLYCLITLQLLLSFLNS